MFEVSRLRSEKPRLTGYNPEHFQIPDSDNDNAETLTVWSSIILAKAPQFHIRHQFMLSQATDIRIHSRQQRMVYAGATDYLPILLDQRPSIYSISERFPAFELFLRIILYHYLLILDLYLLNQSLVTDGWCLVVSVAQVVAASNYPYQGYPNRYRQNNPHPYPSISPSHWRCGQYFGVWKIRNIQRQFPERWFTRYHPDHISPFV